MATRRVLIVDDSKVAQARLLKMLERFELEVDTVLSAEEALGYLTTRHPSVIFLDHHMEGMDGLEALKIIKGNPDTALIPVIMYTSEQGDVYVGQARALGAMDILSKEVMKHANLEQVLTSLGLAGSQETPKQPTKPRENRNSEEELSSAYTLSRDSSGGRPGSATADLDQIKRQISRLFENYADHIREEMEDNTRFLLHRITKDLQDQFRVERATADEAAEPPGEESVSYAVRGERTGIGGVLLGVVLLAVGLFGYQWHAINQHQQALSAQYDELLARGQAQEALIGQMMNRTDANNDSRKAAQTFADRQVLVDALGWAVNVSPQVAFGQQALNDQRIYMLGELLALLKAANFSGTVYLDVHQGNFCVVEDPSGNWMLPEPDSNLSDCVFYADRQEAASIDDQVSVGFLNYIQSTPVLAEGTIEVELASQGYSNPRSSYPPATSAVSAGDWNASAQKNNRISLSFSAN